MLNLTEKEQKQLIDAVEELLSQYLVPATGTFSIVFNGNEKEITNRGFELDKNAPRAVRKLNDIYLNIIEKGALAFDPRGV